MSKNSGTEKLLFMLDEIRPKGGSALDGRIKTVNETWARLQLWFLDGLFCRL